MLLEPGELLINDFLMQWQMASRDWIRADKGEDAAAILTLVVQLPLVWAEYAFK